MKALAFVLFLALSTGQVIAQCRQALLFGLDVSGSVDPREYRLQVDGLANALLSDQVVNKILEIPEVPVALGAFEWSSVTYQKVLFDWRFIRTVDDLIATVDELRSRKRYGPGDTTAIGRAIEFAGRMLEHAPDCWTQTLDLSGDGKNNAAIEPEVARLNSNLAGVTINGLVIGADITVGRDERQMEMMDLSAYFRRNVIWGPDAFIEVAQGFDDFERAMIQKIIKELRELQLGQASNRQ